MKRPPDGIEDIDNQVKSRSTGRTTQYNEWSLVVAGPVDELEVFEAVAAATRLHRVVSHTRQVVPSFWKQRADLSLRSLLRFFTGEQRKRLGHRLPRLATGELVGRSETSNARVRLEYSFRLQRDHAAGVYNLARAIARNRPLLYLIAACANPTATNVHARFFHAGEAESFRLPAARCEVLLRRERRALGRDLASRADDFARGAMLDEVAGRWDRRLAAGS